MAVPIRMLILEDRLADAELLIQELRRAGFDPIWRRVESEAEYLAHLDPELDLIFADYNLPAFDALRALAHMQERGVDIPFIVMTGTLGDEAAAECIKRGATDYLLKDRLARLGPAVTQALEQARLRDKRRQAEAGRRESEVRRGAILDAALDCIITMDHKGTITEFNPAAEQVFGYTRADVLGKELAEVVIPPALRDKHRRGLAHFLTTGETSVLGKRIEMSAMRADGTEFPVELAITRIHVDGPPIFTGFVRDITERKRMEETLQLLYQAGLHIQEPLGLRDRLDRLLQAAQHVLRLDRLIICLHDTAGQWLEEVANTEAEKSPGNARVPIGPEGGALAQAYLTKEMIVWDGRRPVPEPLRLRPPFDQIATLRSRVFAAVPLVIQGRAIGVLGVDRKRSRQPFEPAMLELLRLFSAQAALAIEHGRLYEAQRMAAIQLEATVEARTRELQAANVQLQEAMRQAQAASRHKSVFLANMSHELRTPLNAILGFSELLTQQAYGPLTEKQARYVDNVHTSGQHLLALINDLLDLSKVEAGKLELHLQAFHLQEALEAALHVLRPQAEAKQQALRLQVADDVSTITADPLRVRQILYNLLSNAVKFTPAGGAITVTVKMVSSSEFGVSSSQPETASASEFVEIAVADTGIGIKPDDLARLFQPFTQLEQTLTKSAQGTGLGLALTRRLVELHGGTIRAESAGEGRGSTFTICLPLRSHAS